MAVSSDYLDYVRDQLSGLGGVTSRRMFGGAGLYCDEFFFALVDNDTLYLRVNDSNRAEFTSRAMGQFRPYPESPQLSTSTQHHVLPDAGGCAGRCRRAGGVGASFGRSGDGGGEAGRGREARAARA